MSEAQVVDLPFELDLSTKQQAQREFEKVEGGDVIVNLEGCEFIDSTGLSILFQEYNKAFYEGYHLVIANVSEKLRRVFVVAGLIDLFKIQPSVKEAKRWVSEHQ